MRICFFSTYCPDDWKPYHHLWFNELKKHCDKLVILTNNRPNDLDVVGADVHKLPNIGWDFGQWWRMLAERDFDLSEYDELLLCNDSMLLIKPLDDFFKWWNDQKIDVGGMTSSSQFHHHIQSYFVIYRKSVFHVLKDHFMQNGIITKRHKCIETYEIELSKKLQDLKFRVKARYPHNNFKEVNPVAQSADKLLSMGSPMIKKKVVYNNFNKDETWFLDHYKYDFAKNWKKIISKHSPWPIEKIINDPIIRIYQVYYDETQKGQILKGSIPLFNSSLTPFFENKLIVKLWQDGALEGSDYFGLLSWKFSQKNFTNILEEDYTENPDLIVPPMGLNRRHNVLHDSEKCHPNFRKIFKHVLKTIGKPVNIEPHLGLYQNAVVAKTHIFNDYVKNWLHPTVRCLEGMNGEMRTLLWSNSRYNYNKSLREKLVKFFGKPYYPYHTFICERLWSCYVDQNQKLNIHFLPKRKIDDKIKSENKIKIQTNKLILFSLFEEKDLKSFSEWCVVKLGKPIKFDNENKLGEESLVKILQMIEQIQKGFEIDDLVLYHSPIWFKYIDLLCEYFPNIYFFLPQNPKVKPLTWEDRKNEIKKLPIKLEFINELRDYYQIKNLKKWIE